MAKQQQRPQARPAQQQQQPARRPAPAPVRRPAERKDNIFTAGNKEFIYGTKNFITMGIGLALIILGLILMSGGGMTDPSQWDPNQVYSPRRITVAPICMVAGFLVVILGIFQKPTTTAATEDKVVSNIEQIKEA